MDNINAFKVTVTAIAAGVSALLGWFGWITGSLAAAKKGEWSSRCGWEGIWHKAGCIVVILGTIILDIVIGMEVNNIPSIQLPFTYTVLICLIMLVWYILTELGSIVENAGKRGAPVPDFLKKPLLYLNPRLMLLERN